MEKNVNFIMGENLKILKSHFWPEKYINMGRVHSIPKDIELQHLGGILSKKSWFSQYFHEQIKKKKI